MKRQCKRCFIIKDTEDFVKSKRYKNGHSNLCKSCKSLDYFKNRDKNLAYYYANQERAKSLRKKRYLKNREYELKSNREYVKNNPWIWSYLKALQRCSDKNHPRYHRYGGRGIKFLLTREEIRLLWFRDKAYLQKKPSIDRRDNDGNYTFENCQFIELSENSKKKRRDNEARRHRSEG